MRLRRFHKLACGITVGLALAASSLIQAQTSSSGSVIVHLPFIRANGKLDLKHRDSGDYFNYVITDDGKFNGQATGVVKNRSHRAQVYKNVLSFNLTSVNLQIQIDEFSVAASGAANYLAQGIVSP